VEPCKTRVVYVCLSAYNQDFLIKCIKPAEYSGGFFFAAKLKVAYMTFNEFKSFAKSGYIVPVYKKINADFITPIMTYLKIREPNTYSFLLESALKGEHLGRYSFVGQNPYRVIIASGEKTIIKDHAKNEVKNDSFFNIFNQHLNAYKNVKLDILPHFTCGAIGFIGYDMVRFIENLPLPKHDPLNGDDAVMAFYDTIITFDHLKNEVILIANAFVDQNSNIAKLYQTAQKRLDKLFEKLKQPMQPELHFKADFNTQTSNFKKNTFIEAVKKSKTYIRSGDIFQVVLSQKLKISFEGDVFQVYRALRNINPSPYMFYLDFVDYQIIGSSPESVISATENELEIIPIAGTRPRGQTADQDTKLAKSLLRDPKENAEHVMLVDLARNDMGKVSEYGSVEVQDFRTIEKYSHVMHIISKVTGKLKKENTSLEAFKSAFPAGTVSGAPKIRAMEIIHELEPDKRGIYAGAIGYFDFSGDMDMAIAIRTMIAKENTIYYQAGAGIVADSDPAKEYEETINKGNALRQAIEQATGGFHDFIHR
jgi:anthranilate synthase component 1